MATAAPARSQALGLAAISLGFLLITLDATIVNVALGPIGADLGGALSTAQWIVNGYTLTFAALLLSAGALVAGLASAGAFVVVERAVAHPMVDPLLLRERAFSTAVAIGTVFNFCLYGAIFCLAIDLHRARGLDPLHTGLALLPMTVVTGTMAFLSGRLVGRVGEWLAIVVGLATGAAGALLIALEPPGVSATALIASSVLLGVTALAMPAMTALAMSRPPRDRVGLASGVFNASRQTGGALGVAVLGALLVSGGDTVSLRAAFAAAAAAYTAGVALALSGRRHARVSA